jgi:hypothetical protein
MIYARLHPPVNESGVPYTGLYSVEFNGEVIVKSSRNPEFDLARALLAPGLAGSVTLVDANTLRPRIVIKDIAKAAKFTVRENRSSGPELAKWVPMSETTLKRVNGRSPTVGDEADEKRMLEDVGPVALAAYRLDGLYGIRRAGV